jgi:hypothetical protein
MSVCYFSVRFQSGVETMRSNTWQPLPNLGSPASLGLVFITQIAIGACGADFLCAAYAFADNNNSMNPGTTLNQINHTRDQESLILRLAHSFWAPCRFGSGADSVRLCFNIQRIRWTYSPRYNTSGRGRDPPDRSVSGVSVKKPSSFPVPKGHLNSNRAAKQTSTIKGAVNPADRAPGPQPHFLGS